MHSLSINNLNHSSSEEMIEISSQQQGNIIGGGEETIIIFIGLKPPRTDLTIFLGPPIPSL